MPLLDDMSNTGIWIMTATAKEIYEDERTLLISAKAENNSKLALWTDVIVYSSKRKTY